MPVGLTPEAARWTPYQKAVTLLAALAVVFDGFDLQILAFAIPSIMRDWHVARAAFAPVVAIGLAAMAVGSPVAGYIGDCFGRRSALIGCVILFGLATIATSLVHGVPMLLVLRAIAGAGVGGALPNATALTAEFAPLRRRALAVMLTIMCVPVGGMIAGLVAERVLPTAGWHTLYAIGGAAPLLYALLLLAALPESPGFLTERLSIRRGLLRALFDAELMRETIALWGAFLACFAGGYLMLGWLPSMLSAQGLDIGTASSGLAAYNFGGVLGVLVCSAMVTAMGSRRPVLFAALGGAATALLLTLAHIGAAGSHAMLIAGIGINGFFVNSVQTSLFALAAHVYPTSIRATGVACATAMGRCGGILSSLAGAAIIQAGAGTFLTVLAVAMGAAFVSLAIVRRHY